MDPSPSPLTVSISAAAQDDLWNIWRDNAKRYSDDHADRYLNFLRTEIDQLAVRHGEGRALKGFTEFRYITCKMSRRGHGHYVIFKLDPMLPVIKVLRVYHTSMDITGRVRREFPTGE